MSLFPRSGAALALIVATALGLSACGGDTDSSSDSSSSSSRTSSPDGGELTQASFVTTVSDAQLKASSSHIVMEIGTAGQVIKAEGDVAVGDDIADSVMSMSMDFGSSGLGTFDMRLVDQKFYLNFGQMTEGKFAVVDLNDKNSAFAQQFNKITGQLDPSQQLLQFEEALTSFTKKGDPQTIDGVEAQPYEVVVDTRKVKAFDELPGGAGARLPKTLTYTVFIGPDDLLRRLTSDVAGSKVTVDYSKWGEPVNVEKPAASEISDVDLEQLGAPPVA